MGTSVQYDRTPLRDAWLEGAAEGITGRLDALDDERDRATSERASDV